MPNIETDTTQTAQRCVTQRQRLREVSVHVDTVFDIIDTPARCGDLSDDAIAWRGRPQRPELIRASSGWNQAIQVQRPQGTGRDRSGPLANRQFDGCMRPSPGLPRLHRGLRYAGARLIAISSSFTRRIGVNGTLASGIPALQPPAGIVSIMAFTRRYVAERTFVRACRCSRHQGHSQHQSSSMIAEPEP